MSSPTVNPSGNASAASGPNQSATSSLNKLADPNVFLQLLIAQLKNQDPQNPADGTTFVTQLATFSQVGQSTQMVKDLDSIQALLQAQANRAQSGQTSAGQSSSGQTSSNSSGAAQTTPAAGAATNSQSGSQPGSRS